MPVKIMDMSSLHTCNTGTILVSVHVIQVHGYGFNTRFGCTSFHFSGCDAYPCAPPVRTADNDPKGFVALDIVTNLNPLKSKQWVIGWSFWGQIWWCPCVTSASSIRAVCVEKRASDRLEFPTVPLGAFGSEAGLQSEDCVEFGAASKGLLPSMTTTSHVTSLGVP